MKKATRILLNHRPNAKHVLVEKVYVEDALQNHCYQNAIKLADTNEKDMIIVSGWLVGDFFGERGTAIIPHYFVVNIKTRKYYDATPLNANDKQSYEYVRDIEIMTYSHKKAVLPLTLKLTADGLFKARSDDGKYFYDLDKIEIAELYALRDNN